MKLFLIIPLLLISCTGIPKGLEAVDGFEIERYLGTWYEVARLDHSFERGLENISATYRLRADGGLDVLNTGWDKEDGEWKTAKGRAYFIQSPDKGRLKVNFLGPFYSSYNIIALDKINYSYAMVTGPSKSYLWILSRNKQMPKAVFDTLTAKAENLGFDTDRLIMVDHSGQ
ncbi:MAG: lipocalin family protein [Gammaproteobacteria bacterium]